MRNDNKNVSSIISRISIRSVAADSYYSSSKICKFWIEKFNRFWCYALIQRHDEKPSKSLFVTQYGLLTTILQFLAEKFIGRNQWAHTSIPSYFGTNSSPDEHSFRPMNGAVTDSNSPVMHKCLLHLKSESPHTQNASAYLIAIPNKKRELFQSARKSEI